MKDKIGVKISRERLEELYKMFGSINLYIQDGDHKELLLSHADEIKQKIKAMLKKEYEINTLRLSKSDTLAFVQLFQSDNNLYRNAIIKSIVEKINKQV